GAWAAGGRPAGRGGRPAGPGRGGAGQGAGGKSPGRPAAGKRGPRMTAGRVVPDLLGAAAPPAVARRVALAGDGWTMSFGELGDDARRGQRLLRGSGGGRGDRGAILAGHGPAYLAVLYGAALCGAAVVLLHTRLDAPAIRSP